VEALPDQRRAVALNCAALRPAAVAAHFRISACCLDGRFAEIGTSFVRPVLARRLDRGPGSRPAPGLPGGRAITAIRGAFASRPTCTIRVSQVPVTPYRPL